MTFSTIDALLAYYATLPSGTESDVLSSDLERGNFDIARLFFPDGSVLLLSYTGEVLPE